MFSLGYALIVFLPVFLYAQRGRRTGKMSPKMAATLVALAVAFISPYTFLIDVIFFNGPTQQIPWDLIWLAAGLFVLIWLAAYAGPLGMGLGWAGRWNGYVYPERKKKGNQLPVTTSPTTLTGQKHQNSWRRLMWEMGLGELAVLLGVGLIFQKPFIIPLGVGIVLLHLLAFAAIWRWKHKQLEEKGWRW